MAKRNKYKLAKQSFTHEQAMQLFTHDIINVDEAREIMGLNEDELTLPFDMVVRLKTAGILSTVEARELLGYDGVKPAAPQPSPSTPIIR